MIEKVLIANRGEIAVRVIRACRELDIPSVAVYSPVDRRMPHVHMAGQAYELPGNLPADGYLKQEFIIEIAKEAKADAIHPGYGFLSENAGFARACAEAGITFIGPSPESIQAMGDKLSARALAKKAGVPLIPGSETTISTLEEASEVAETIGYPLMIKASAGGGGKGMRVVDNEDRLADAMERAQSEARTAFGDDRIYVERYFPEGHHIEIQVLADDKGHTIHLFERECSIQRRHQKVIEETPSPTIDAVTRAKMGAAAVALAKACNYTGAGTVEFLYSDGQAYFLEMNTRLQVEHPVTELVTGIDLVKWQLRIAAGEPLSLNQDDVSQRGHAIQCRIYAEHPVTFLAAPGDIDQVIEPAGPFVRVDSCIASSTTVPMFYDPLLSKLIVWAGDRKEAIGRMRGALDEYAITGIHTNIPFHRWIMRQPEFIEGKTTTRFIEKHYGKKDDSIPDDVLQAMLAAIAIDRFRQDRELTNGNAQSNEAASNTWKNFGRFERLRS